jgi:hypothetical protein
MAESAIYLNLTLGLRYVQLEQADAGSLKQIQIS